LLVLALKPRGADIGLGVLPWGNLESGSVTEEGAYALFSD
jgi:hypothetical protein